MTITWKASTSCVRCGKSTDHRGPQAKYCSDRCRWDTDHEKQTARARARRQAEGRPIPGDLVPCGNTMCSNTAIYKSGQPYCSITCRTVAHRYRQEGAWPSGPHSRVYFGACPDCGQLLARRSKAPARCRDCAQMRARAVDARKNHKRRASGRITVTMRDLANRDGERCHICRKKIDLSLSGMTKWGPTIDHILPVSCGGTNDESNLALAHRHCNSARGNRQPAQMLLTA